MKTQSITIHNNTFILHPGRAAFWKEKKILFVADTHFGKISHFRKYGIAIPRHGIKKDYKNLNFLVQEFQPETVCFLGDLFHSNYNQEWIYFQKWVKTVSIGLILVKGNHDIIPDFQFEDLGVKLSDEMIVDNFVLTHHPIEKEGFFNICGHIHPGIELKSGRQRLNLPCFYKTDKQLILPSFGSFTGKYILKPNENDTVFAVTPDEVILIST